MGKKTVQTTFTTKLLLDRSDVDAGTKQAQQDADKVDTKIDNSRMKLMLLWSYGNQLANMLLQQFSKAAEGTEAQAKWQAVIAGLQVAQGEMMVYMTGKQAAAAFLTGTPWGFAQGVMLTSIAGMMQSGIIQAQINKYNAEETARRTAELRRQMEAYNL